jgi:hypothetical protein
MSEALLVKTQHENEKCHSLDIKTSDLLSSTAFLKNSPLVT